MTNTTLTILALVTLVPLVCQVILYWQVWNGNRDDIEPRVLLTGLLPLLGLAPLMGARESQRNGGIEEPPVVLNDPGDFLAQQRDLGLDDLDTMETH